MTNEPKNMKPLAGVQPIRFNLPIDIPTGDKYSPSEMDEWEKEKVQRMNEEPGTLQGYDCALCHNKGYIYIDRDNRKPCECMEIRNSLARASQSMLSKEMLSRYTFAKYKAESEWQKKVFKAAAAYAKNPAGWFFIGGQPGAGKTHLCVAIFNRMIRAGSKGKYMEWRSTAQALKAVMNTSEYLPLMEQFQNAPLLYIDDLFKVQNGGTVPPGDVNLAIELLYNRYNHPDRLTIISSEWMFPQLLNIDEGLASRIRERAGKNSFDISKDPCKNSRMKNGNGEYEQITF